MPGSISDSYDGPADPCPRCRQGDRVIIDVWCHWCKGTTWLPDDDEVVIVTDDDEEDGPEPDTDVWSDDGGQGGEG